MSDAIKHECGIAFIRLRKPLEFYKEKYGTELWGLKKLQMLMNKQLNRGQDGSGLAVIKLDPEYGSRYIASLFYKIYDIIVSRQGVGSTYHPIHTGQQPERYSCIYRNRGYYSTCSNLTQYAIEHYTQYSSDGYYLINARWHVMRFDVNTLIQLVNFIFNLFILLK